MTSTLEPSRIVRAARAERFARQVAARLSDASYSMPHDISERLRVARLQAIAAHRQALKLSVAPAFASRNGSELTLGGDDAPSWWMRFVSAVPLLALVFGLFAINSLQNEIRTNELAEVDTALLTDDLPPAAYADPGFAQFLKFDNRAQTQE